MRKFALMVSVAALSTAAFAARYRLTTATDKTADKAPFAEATIGFWTDLDTGDPATVAIGPDDICYVYGYKFVASSFSPKFPGSVFHFGSEAYAAGTFAMRGSTYDCGDLRWHCGEFIMNDGGSQYVIRNGTMTVDGGSSVSHKVDFTSAAPSAAGHWSLGFTAQLLGTDPTSVITVLLNSSAMKDCYCKGNNNPLDAQIYFSADNSGYAGRFVVNKFGHLGFDSATSAGAPETLVADKIELQANSRLAVKKDVELNANCGITVSGTDARLVAKTYGSGLGDCSAYTLRMPIASAADTDFGIVKDGDGTVTLAGPYTAGDIEVAAGTLVLSAEGQFRSGLKVTVKSGAKLVQNAFVPGIDVTCEEGGTYEKDVTYRVPYDAATGVTTPLDLSDFPDEDLPVTLQLAEAIAVPFHETNRLDVAKVSATATADDFSDGSPKTYGLPRTSFEIEERGDVRMLVMVARPVVVSTKAIPNDTSAQHGLNGTAETWSNGAAAQPGFDYLLLHLCDGFYSKFMGDSVTLTYTTSMHFLRSGTSYFGAASVYPGVGFKGNSGNISDFVFSGALDIVKGDDDSKYVTFETSYAGGGKRQMEVHVNVPLMGAGNVKFTSSNALSRDIAVSGDNSDFYGRVLVTATASPTAENSTILYFNEPKNLGGALSTFESKALRLEQHAVICPNKSMTLETENRGISVASGGFLVNEGLTLTVREPVSLEGTLYKKGAGTLALGGDVSFGAKGKVLSVVEGAVTPLVDAAVAGLDATFADGTKIVLDPAAETVDGFTGMVAAAGTVSVVLDVLKATRGTTYALPICTVASDAADLSSVFVAANVRGFTTKVEKVTLDDGRIRYQLCAEPKGLILFLR